MNSSPPQTWYSITLAPQPQRAAEEYTFDLFETGIEGLIHNDDQTMTGYFSSDSGELADFISKIEAHSLVIKEIKLVEEKNWVAECSDLFEPLLVGSIKVNPISDCSKVSKDVIDEDSRIIIDLIPGFGFGTGHHETTRCCIEFLQHQQVKDLNPKKVLDMGAGSGILSIAVSKLYGSRIDAAEIDNEALENARENIKINNCAQNISIMNKPGDTGYDLIVANIYAEVLVLLEPEFAARIKPGGLLIISGVIQPMAHLIDKQYAPERWKQYASKNDNNWVTRGYVSIKN